MRGGGQDHENHQHQQRRGNGLSLASPPSGPQCCAGNSSVDPSRVACGIWLYPEQDRTIQELQTMDRDERERVWADLVGDTKGNATAASSATMNDHDGHGDAAVADDWKLNDGGVNGNTSTADEELDDDVTDEMLHQLRQELDKISPSSNSNAHDKTSYQKALEQDPQYANSSFFLKRILRSDNLDIRAAAKRIMLHFEIKELLFGEDVLGRDITIDDLSEDDLNALRSGSYYFLCPCDHAKRRVIFSRLSSVKYKRLENMIRSMWYATMEVTSDIRVQRLGVVFISYLLDDYPTHGMDMEFLRLAVKSTHALPLRIAAIYYCCPKKETLYSSPWEQVVDFLMYIVGRIIRVRARIVRGSHQECVYQAYCLGLPPRAIPIYENGEMREPHAIDNWINQQSQRLRAQQDEHQQQISPNEQRHGDEDGSAAAMATD